MPSPLLENTDVTCSKSFISLFICYFVSFIYVFEKHTKFWGYILLIITYLFSFLFVYQYKIDIETNFRTLAEYLKESSVYIFRVFLVCLFCIVFFSLYSLIKILNAYAFKSTKDGTFDLKLSARSQRELKMFDNSFIVGNISLFVFIMLIAKGVDFGDSVKTNGAQLFLFMVAFICVWIQMVFATRFSYIKRT